ncbi:signal peptide peptidase-domain-containing protein [Syncephalis pseudoplumigaleata]|uniref:Signal peptide peptidase-domain-containing protein n=1 Tax=Syncephalis pseudoplumigaleata TaxID=1712513 RepID=A0A4P9Z6K7_9FUNG|nr:signal peptide peptidase-domain-containing protein [Syncephalis pseudoplumigaleata]|eukprot:RKP28088.1 signal peptide peptidase-domain-containing protein [Syncephalis pseudoplumigaleata]
MDPGLLTAYVALSTMAVVPIYYGSFLSLKKIKRPAPSKHKADADVSSESESEEETESLSTEDAYMFPLLGSAVLFSMYLIFRFLNKEYINYLVTTYFAIIGVAALTKLGAVIIRGVTGIKERSFHLRLNKANKEYFDVRFTRLHMVSAVISFVCTAYYAYTKNWIVSNLFGIAFSLSAVQLIQLDSFKTGFILLAGLFFYDIFWVFGTEVMVSVAKNFNAPIKVMFPRSFFVAAGEKMQFTMLGLGDIVIPGVFVAMCLRFDQYLARRSTTPPTHDKPYAFAKPYFYGAFAAYVIGLTTTFVVMHTFKAAQPALLYLSPACSLSAIIVAAMRGELSQLFSYTADPPADDKKKKNNKDGDDKQEAANKDENAIKADDEDSSNDEDDAGDEGEKSRPVRRSRRNRK